MVPKFLLMSYMAETGRRLGGGGGHHDDTTLKFSSMWKRVCHPTVLAKLAEGRFILYMSEYEATYMIYDNIYNVCPNMYFKTSLCYLSFKL